MFKNGFSYDQTTKSDTWNPLMKISEKKIKQKRLDEKGRNNHCVQGSQKSNSSKTNYIESTVLNSNLELLRKSVEMFKNQKEKKMKRFENLSKTTSSANRKNELTKKISFPDEITATLIKSKNMDRSKYKISHKKGASNKPSILLSSNENQTTPHKSLKRKSHTPNSNDDLHNSKVLTTNELPKTCEYHISSHSILSPNFKRHSSGKSIQTINNVDECCLHRFSSPLETPIKTSVPDHSGNLSSKQPILPPVETFIKPPTVYNSCCFHRPITPPHVRKPIQNSSCCWCFQQQNSLQTHRPILNCFCCCCPEKQNLINMKPSEKTDTMMKSMNRPESNESHRETTYENPSFDSLSSYGYRLTTYRSTKHSSDFNNLYAKFSNSKVFNEPPKTIECHANSNNTLAPNSKRKFSHKSTQTKKDDDFCFHRSSSVLKPSNKTLVSDDNGYYSSKQQSPHSVTTRENGTKNEFSKKISFSDELKEKSIKTKNCYNPITIESRNRDLSILPNQQTEQNQPSFRHSNYNTSAPSTTLKNAYSNQRSYHDMNNQNNPTLNLPPH